MKNIGNTLIYIFIKKSVKVLKNTYILYRIKKV